MPAYPFHFLLAIHIALTPFRTSLEDFRCRTLAVEMILLRPCVQGNKVYGLAGNLDSCPTCAVRHHGIFVTYNLLYILDRISRGDDLRVAVAMTCHIYMPVSISRSHLLPYEVALLARQTI